MNCPKDIFAEIYRQNLLLGPQCKTETTKAAFSEYENSLYELRKQIENQTQMDECKVSDEVYKVR